jgi:uncharacterized protein YggE
METIETNHVIDLSDRLYKLPIALIAVLGVLGVGWLFYSFASLPQNAPHEINVSGDGKAYAKPDVAVISFGAHTEAPKSQDAVAQNNNIMNAVSKAVKDLGVKDEDIQTTMYSLQSLYDYNVPIPMMAPMSAGSAGKGIVSYPIPTRSTVLRGYSLDQQVQVKIRNFDNINAILDVASKNGANTIGNLQFTVDNMEKFKSEARADAIAAAKQKAMDMFGAAGLGGAKIVNISEGYNNYPQPMYSSAMAKDSMATTAPSVQTGQLEVDTTVTLTYRVQ